MKKTIENIKTSYIKVGRQARFTSWGNLSKNTKYFWFVLHGSKMLSEQMLYKFSDFDPEMHYIVAPEALNKFYANGFGGDVVASWMTSRDRLYEIDDFSNYLSQLYTQVKSQLPSNCIKSILGFSQGGTTMFRWLHAMKVDVDNIVGYSCWIPEDIAIDNSQTQLNAHKVIYTYGQKDAFLTPERLEALKEIISKNKLKIFIEPYKGSHRIDRAQLAYLLKKYIER